MRTIQALVATTLVIFSLLSFLAVRAHGQTLPQKVTSIKLLTLEMGWAATGHTLFWTNNAGHEWKEITPKAALSEEIASVFFLDTSHGWTLMSAWNKQADLRQVDLAATADSGTSWTVTPIRIPDFAGRGLTLSGGGRVDFVDQLHGWVNLDLVSGAAFHLGLLLATADGGKTWTRAPGGSGTAGDIIFVSTEKGWVTSGDEIYVTRDGAKNWQRLSLVPPKQIYPAVNPTYALPTFVDDHRGFLPVTYSGPDGSHSALVLFATIDGGLTWTTDRILTGLEGTSVGQIAPATVVDSLLVAGEVSGQTGLSLTTMAPSSRASKAIAETLTPDSGILQLSFASSTLGWALVVDARYQLSRILLTGDGGSTWTDVTPPPVVG